MSLRSKTSRSNRQKEPDNTTETTQQETQQQNSKTWKQFKCHQKIKISKENAGGKGEDQGINFASKRHKHNNMIAAEKALTQANKHSQNANKQQQ